MYTWYRRHNIILILGKLRELVEFEHFTVHGVTQ